MLSPAISESEEIVASLQNPESMDHEELYAKLATAHAYIERIQNEYFSLDAEIKSQVKSYKSKVDPRKLNKAATDDMKRIKESYQAEQEKFEREQEAKERLRQKCDRKIERAREVYRRLHRTPNPQDELATRGRSTIPKRTVSTKNVRYTLPNAIQYPSSTSRGIANRPEANATPTRTRPEKVTKTTAPKPNVAKNNLAIAMNVPQPDEQLGKRERKKRTIWEYVEVSKSKRVRVDKSIAEDAGKPSKRRREAEDDDDIEETGPRTTKKRQTVAITTADRKGKGKARKTRSASVDPRKLAPPTSREPSTTPSQAITNPNKRRRQVEEESDVDDTRAPVEKKRKTATSTTVGNTSKKPTTTLASAKPRRAAATKSREPSAAPPQVAPKSNKRHREPENDQDIEALQPTVTKKRATATTAITAKKGKETTTTVAAAASAPAKPSAKPSQVMKTRSQTPQVATTAGAAEPSTMKKEPAEPKAKATDPKRSAAMKAVWKKRQNEGRSGRHGGAPLQSTVTKHARGK